MKKILFTPLVLLVAFSSLQSQIFATLNVNNTKVTVGNNGSLFWDGQNGQFIAGQPAISTMKSAGVWFAGLDGGGNLKGAAQLYNESGKSDFQPGIIDAGTGVPLNLLTDIYRVTKAEILAHTADFNDNGVIDNPIPAIFGWPATGNDFFDDYHNGETLPNATSNDFGQGLAGFYDINANGKYNPDQGDYPVVEIRGCEEEIPKKPSEMLWFVFNDKNTHTQSNMASAGIEFQCTVFAYNCEESPFNNTVFVLYKIINRSFEDMEQTYFGTFMDMEIGNGNDDFFGSDSERSMVFGYNGDSNDEGGYGSNPPAMALDLFRGLRNENNEVQELAHVIPVSSTGPANPIEYYNLLQGSFEDGTAAPNNGFLYDGDPNNPNEWSEVSEGNTPGDRKILASYGPFKLQPGAVNEMILGYSFFQAPNGNTQQNLEGMFQQADEAQVYFDNCFSNLPQCTPIALAVNDISTSLLKVFPNPASDEVTINMPAGKVSDIAIFSLNGQLMSKTAIAPSASETTLTLNNLPAGFYLLHAYKDGIKTATAKIVVIK